jgi:hypothetical protein
MTAKQQDYIKSLIQNIRDNETSLNAAQSAVIVEHSGIIAAVLGGETLQPYSEVSELITVLKPIAAAVKPASEAQVSFIATLCEQKGQDPAQYTNLTAVAASGAITTLKALPNVAKNTTNPRNTPVTAVDPDVEAGSVHYANGTWFRVKKSQVGRLYALRFNGRGFEYDKGAITLLSAGTKVTAEQAAAFGHQYGNCVFCSKDLTDDRSVTVGYGPVCAKNNHLPWGV